MSVTKNSGTFLLNIFRTEKGIHNGRIVISNPAGPAPYIIHLASFSNGGAAEDPSQYNPVIIRFSSELGFTVTDGLASRDILIADTDSFAFPSDYEDDVPLHIGIGKITALDEFVLVASRNRLTDGFSTAVTATDDDSNLAQSVQSIDDTVWLGYFVGQKRTAGLWDFTTAQFIPSVGY